MNRELFSLSGFTKEFLPAYPCPSCGSPLELDAKDLDFEETADSIRNHDDDDFDHDWVRYQFFAKLRCPSKRCAEVVHCLGTGGVQEVHEYDSRDGQPYEVGYQEYFTPQYFTPPLNIVQLPEHCSDDVAKRMLEAFKLFFASPNSTLNALRSALEYVLDDLRIPRLNDTRKRMSLHSRIDEIDPTTHGLNKGWLHALKIMGNAGTHGEEVDLRQVLDGFEVMEAVLAKVYEKHKVQRIDRIAEETIQRKSSV